MSYTPLTPSRPLTVDALYSVHYFEYDSCYAFAGESHAFWEMLYVDKGSLRVTAGERQLVMTSGQIIFHPPGEFHALSATGGTAPDLVVVGFGCDSTAMDYFHDKVLYAGAEERALMGRIVEESASAFATPLNDPSTTQLVRRKDAPFGGEQRIASALEEMLIQLIRKGESIREHSRGQTDTPESQWMEAMERYLIQRLDRPLTIEEVCRDNLIGRSQLQKRFNQLTGGGVMAYFSKLKIQAARRLIREGELNMTEISTRLGYQSVHYFSRQFKQHTGMSPSQYARSVKMLSGLPGTSTDDRANNV